jgi:tetrathionate reductase subunit B
MIDIEKCNGCYNCQVACKDEHAGNDWTPIAKPQPDTGHFWMKVTDLVQGTVPKVTKTAEPIDASTDVNVGGIELQQEVAG